MLYRGGFAADPVRASWPSEWLFRSKRDVLSAVTSRRSAFSGSCVGAYAFTLSVIHSPSRRVPTVFDQ
jgi:hypothetical protein